jgi:TatD DNase family protein
MFLDIHTHNINSFEVESSVRTQTTAASKSIFNQIIPQDEESLENFVLNESSDWLSVGIHPWYIDESNSEIQLKKLIEVADNQRVKFIGECGLDRLTYTPLPIQEAIFLKQIRIAEEVGKPVIIHCVRCFSELIAIKKLVRPKVPLIVHGFNQSLQIAEQLIQKGFFLSFGEALLHTDSNAQKALELIPINQFYLETDNKEVSIQKIYEKASEIKKIAINQLEDRIFENYLSITI